MNEQQKHLENLAEVRKLMENSSRFLSVSGLSGVAIGMVAFASATFAHFYFGIGFLERNLGQALIDGNLSGLLALGAATFAAALLVAAVFTFRKAKKQNAKVFGPASEKMLKAIGIPLVTGACFCLALLNQKMGVMVAPAMLVFYGLALINGSKYTHDDLRSLGYIEIFFGIIAGFFTGFGLLFWTLGFGLGHLVYGLLMHKKYGA